MSSYAYESDDDDDKPLPPLKKRSEFDDDDVPIRLKKFSKQQPDDDARIRSETDTYLNQDMNNTKKRLEDIKQNFFDVCLENFEHNEAGAIGFFVYWKSAHLPWTQFNKPTRVTPAPPWAWRIWQ